MLTNKKNLNRISESNQKHMDEIQETYLKLKLFI